MKKTPYLIANGLMEDGQLVSARRYLEQRSESEQSEYPFLRSWSELLWRESSIGERTGPGDLKLFTRSIVKVTSDLEALVTLNDMRVLWTESNHKSAVEIGLTFLEGNGVLEDQFLRPDIQMCLGNCWMYLRNLDLAVSSYEKALEEYQLVGDDVRAAQSLDNIAMCRRVGRDWAGSVSLYSQAIRIFRAHGQVLSSFVPTLGRGNIHVLRGQFVDAQEDIDAAIRIARSYSKSSWLTSALTSRGLLEARSTNFSASAKTLASALRIARANKLIRHSALLYEYIGELRFRQGNARSARVWLNRAIALSQTRGLRDIEHESRCRLAEVELQEGNLDLAESHAREACSNFESMNDQYEIAVCQRVIGQILWTRDQKDEANIFFDRATDFFSAVGELYESQKIARIRTADQMEAASPPPTTETPTDKTSKQSKSKRNVQSVPAYAEPFQTRKKKEAGTTAANLPTSWHPAFPDLLSESPIYIDALDRLADLARAKVSLLILGESGTGKEAVVRGIHRLSPRSQGEFIAFNCATSTPGMFDAEFYGHSRGSFTGAESMRFGLARTADHGTLFLDEIGELGKDLQGRILRFLDSGEIRPVGSDRSLRVDVRVIAATHCNLEELEKQGRFRHDLRFRLSELSVTLPPLRERPEDIPLLVDYYLQQSLERGIGQARRANQSVIDSMLLYSWPGNVRELRNEVFTIAAFSPRDTVAKFWKRPDDPSGTLPTTRDELIAALEAAQGNVAQAGRMLRENRVGLYRLMRALEVDPSQYRPH